MVKRLLVIMVLVIALMLGTSIQVFAGDPEVDITIIGASPDVTVNTGANSTVSVNGEGLATSSMLNSMRPTEYDDPWMSRGEFRRWLISDFVPIMETRNDLSVTMSALAKDITLDEAQDKALKEVIAKIDSDNQKIDGLFITITGILDSNITAIGEVNNFQEQALIAQSEKIAMLEAEIETLKQNADRNKQVAVKTGYGIMGLLIIVPGGVFIRKKIVSKK